MNKEIVLITGTNSGFGLLATLELAKNEYFVIATMRNLDNQHELIDKAKQLKIEHLIEILPLDVTNEQEIHSIIHYIDNHYGQIDILINNAGFCLGGMCELVAITDWKKQFETNFFGVVHLTQKVIPYMRKQKKGKIINIGSISGRFGFPGLGPYVASKHALEGYSESLRTELLPFEISVSIIEAGSYNTNIWKKALNEQRLETNEDYRELMKVIYDEATKTAENADDPKEVIKTILKICQTKKPKLRYIVGKGTKQMIFLKNILPWSMLEKLIQKKLSHTNRRK